MVDNEQRSSLEGKAVVAIRYTLLRQALASLVGDLGFDSVAEADSPESLLQIVAQERPRAVLMESELGDDMEQLVAKLAACDPRPAVVLLAPPGSQGQLQPALKAGTNGYLSFNITAEELGDTLKLLLRGGLIVSGEMAGALSANGPEPLAEEPYPLSQREREVLGLVANGATNREIAEALVVTEHTVKVHLRNVLDKLHLRNRQQAAAFAVREGIAVEPVSEEP